MLFILLVGAIEGRLSFGGKVSGSVLSMLLFITAFVVVATVAGVDGCC